VKMQARARGKLTRRRTREQAKLRRDALTQESALREMEQQVRRQLSAERDSQSITFLEAELEEVQLARQSLTNVANCQSKIAKYERLRLAREKQLRPMQGTRGVATAVRQACPTSAVHFG
jgi:hypothetical protein